MRRMTMFLSLLVGLSVPGLANAQKVSIALPVATLESMPIFVAQDKGFFKKAGVDVDIITSRGGSEAMKAYIAGDVQFAAIGFPEVGLMREKGVDAELFFAQCNRVPFALIARTGSGIKSVKDLKGKTVAVTSPGSLTANIAKYFAMKAGLDPVKDVHFVSVGGGPGILGALKSKSADAAMLFEPFVTIAVKQGMATKVVDVAKELNAFMAAPVTTSKAFIDKHPKEAKAIFDALAEAQKYIRSNHDGVMEIAKKRFANANPAVLAAALDTMYGVYSPDGKVSKENLKLTQEISIQLKIMKKSYPYDEVVAPMARE